MCRVYVCECVKMSVHFILMEMEEIDGAPLCASRASKFFIDNRIVDI